MTIDTEEIIDIENHISGLRTEIDLIKSEFASKIKKAEERKIKVFSDQTGIIKGSRVLLSGALEGTHIICEITFVCHNILGTEIGFTVMEIGKKGNPIGREKDVIIHSNENCGHWNRVFILQILDGRNA